MLVGEREQLIPCDEVGSVLGISNCPAGFGHMEILPEGGRTLPCAGDCLTICTTSVGRHPANTGLLHRSASEEPSAMTGGAGQYRSIISVGDQFPAVHRGGSRPGAAGGGLNSERASDSLAGPLLCPGLVSGHRPAESSVSSVWLSPVHAIHETIEGTGRRKCNTSFGSCSVDRFDRSLYLLLELGDQHFEPLERPISVQTS